MINRDRLVENFLEMVRIDSPSGEEDEIAGYLTGKLEAVGLEVKTDSYGNLIASDGRDGPFMLSAHMDTVEPGRGIEPAVDGDRIRSDGTTILGGDCKAGIAAILEGLQSVHEDGTPHDPIEVVFTREEEPGLIGANALDFSMVKSTEAIVFDGEGPPSRITVASPTYVGLEFEITGRAAHAGMEPEKGLSAIRIAADLIAKLPQGRLDPATTFNIGVIEGGSVRNAVPSSTTVRGEFRSSNIETLDQIKSQIAGVVGQVRDMYPEAVVSEHIHDEFETYTIEDDDPFMLRIEEALRSLGMEATHLPSGGGSDGNVFRQRGIASVVVGMSDHNAHTVDEYVIIPDMVDAAHLCETMMRSDG